MEAKTPRDGKEFVGFLAGARRSTRDEIAKEFLHRYGVRIVKHIGHEHEKDVHPFIAGNTEIVIIIADDIHPPQMQRILKCAQVLGITPIAINRKAKPVIWDGIMNAEGYKSPPPWRDGFLIPNVADPQEKPRTAWVDKQLVDAGPLKIPLGSVPVKTVEEVLNQYKPAPKTPPAAPPSAKQGPLKNAGDDSHTAFAVALLSAREKAKLSQAVACKKVGIEQTMMSSYEHAKTIPLYGVWLKLLKVFPDLPAPEGMKGQASFEKVGGLQKRKGVVEKVSITKAMRARLVELGFAKAAEEEESPAPAPPAKPEPAPAPSPAIQVSAAPSKLAKVETPPPPSTPPAVVVQQPAVFAEKVIKAMDQEELLTINLRSGGSITLMASVQLMKIKKDDREFVFSIIDALQAYEEKKE